jgi:lysophospholipase L1-like esterase
MRAQRRRGCGGAIDRELAGRACASGPVRCRDLPGGESQPLLGRSFAAHHRAAEGGRARAVAVGPASRSSTAAASATRSRAAWARFQRDVIAYGPDLVVWQLGTNDVAGADAPMASRIESQRACALKATGADVILMHLQYAPLVLASPQHSARQALPRWRGRSTSACFHALP